MSTLKRRSFLSGSAALITSALSGGALAAESAPQNIPGLPAKWDYTADVVVIGAGGAGLHAAIQAHESGANVIVINKAASSYHSATATCGGGFAAFGTYEQQKEGSDDTIDYFVEDIMKFGNYQNNRDLVRNWGLASGKAYNWMTDHGLKPHRLEKYQGHNHLRYERSLSYTGRDYIEVLLKEIEDQKIPVLTETPLTKIYFDPQQNRVIGIAAEKDGKQINLRALKGIVLAAGGFTGDPKFFDRWAPHLNGKGVCIGAPTNDGKALMVAVRDCGVPITHMQYFASYPCGVQTRKRNGIFHRYWYLVDEGGILVNKNGKRFCSERLGQTKVGELLAGQPENCHFILIDAEGWKSVNEKRPPNALFALPAWTRKRIEEEVALGRIIFKADSLEGLAEKAGINAQALKDTVAHWNQYVQNGKDPDFARDPADMKRQLGAGPYYAVRMNTWANLVLGGLQVNKDLQVLNWNNEPINGFYAAGETVGGAHGNSFLGGNGVSFACSSGYQAGQNVAKAS